MASPENWTRENLAWMAGIFEGEGYVQGRSRKYNRADGREFTTVGFRLAITMSDEDVIKRFHQLAGVGTCNGPRRSPSAVIRFPDGKPMWDYRASGSEAYALAIALWQWLGVRRRDQLKTAIEAWRQSPGHWSKKQIKI
jgi:hypothetical protein